MGTHIALLRGINVGGKHKLPMRDLVPIFEASGCDQVSTYIQSGNVIFEASAADAKAAREAVQAEIEAQFGFHVPVVLRSKAALAKIAAESPLSAQRHDPKTLAVAFLARKPTAAALRTIDPERFAPDQMKVVGSDAFLHYPNGIARSKLTTAYLDRSFDCVSTVRNWNTVSKLVELSNAR